MRRCIPLIFLIISFSCTGQQNKSNVDNLDKGSLKEASIDSQKISQLSDEISTGKYNIHSVLILRDNKLVYENYFSGKDEVLTTPVGLVHFTRDSLHDCRSLTKSVVSACVGIAIMQNKIKNIDEKVMSYFPEWAKYDTGFKKDITIKDLLTMTAGLEWNENIPYSNPLNSEIQMFVAKDVVDFALSRPAVAKPGTVWNYSAACTELLAKILEKTTGEKIDSFANKNLFAPLGIEKFQWYEREDGTAWAPSGLRLRPVDMAKFGLLYLNNGKSKGRQIISPDWVQQSLKWQINARSSAQGYGYQFWVKADSVAGQKVRSSIAVGFGGQRIYLIPQLNLEIVITAGNYNELSDLPDDVVSKFIFPAILK